MPSPTTQIIVGLECGHQNVFLRSNLPRIGEPVNCWRCAVPKPVITHIGSYTATCDQCTYRRWFGSAKLKVWREARLHAAEYAHHRVTVALGSRILGYTGRSEQPTLDDALDEISCPF